MLVRLVVCRPPNSLGRGGPPNAMLKPKTIPALTAEQVPALVGPCPLESCGYREGETALYSSKTGAVVRASLFTPATVTPPPRQLPPLRTLLAMHRNALEAIDAELFDLPFRRSRSFGKEYLAVCDPQLMEAVLLEHADNFGRSELQQRAFRPLAGEGLLVAEGAEWRRQRRAAAPAFRHEALLRMVPAFAAAAEASVTRLRTASGPVDVEPEMRRATLQVVMDTLLASYDGAVPEVVAHTLFGDVVVRPTALDLMGAPAWIPAPGRALYRSRLKALREQAEEAVRRRRMTELTPVISLARCWPPATRTPAPASPTSSLWTTS